MDDRRRRYENVSELLHEAASVPNAQKAQGAFHRARAMIPGPYTGGVTREPACVPHSNIPMSAVHPPLAGDYCQPMLAPSRILVVQNIPSIDPQDTSPGEKLEFSSGGGWLIGWRGSVADWTQGAFRVDALTQHSVGLTASVNAGDEQLITNGESFDFVRFEDIFPLGAMMYAPLLRRIDVKDSLFFHFRNFQPLAAQGGHALTPSLAFQFWREKYPGMNG
jgi:hypothetical protein